MSSSPHTGSVPWAKYGHGDAHMAELDNGWYLFVTSPAPEGAGFLRGER